MTRIVLRAAVLLAAMGMGWGGGQSAIGWTRVRDCRRRACRIDTITCVKGCRLAFVERGVNPNDTPMPTFSYKCSGPNVERCSSRKVGGWIAP